MSNINIWQSPGKYELNEIVLTNFEGREVSIGYLIPEFTYYESINSLFGVYSFTVVDAVNILERYVITGNEKITLTLIKKDTPDGDEVQITKNLILTKIDSYTRPNNEGQAYTFKALSEEAYYASVARVSKSAKGTPATLIRNLWEEVRYTTGLTINDNTIGNQRIVYPNYTYTDTLKMLLSRCSSANASPFYMYETLWQDQILSSYEYMAYNFAFDKYIQKSEDNLSERYDGKSEFEYNRTRILAFNSNVGVSHFDGLKNGAYYSRVNNIDIGTKKYSHQDKNIFDSFAWLINPDVILDDKLQISSRYVDEIKNAKEYTVQTNTMSYNNNGYNPHQDTPGYIADRSFVTENQLSITHNISVYGDTRLHAGRLIEISIPPAMNPEDLWGDVQDDLFSGLYLVATVMHKFDSSGNYKQTLGIRKDSIDKSLLEGKYDYLQGKKGYGGGR